MAATTVDNRTETVSLIGSDKVDGTAVYGADWDWGDRARDRAVYGYYDTPLWY